jgi:hypothetical protein
MKDGTNNPRRSGTAEMIEDEKNIGGIGVFIELEKLLVEEPFLEGLRSPECSGERERHLKTVTSRLTKRRRSVPKIFVERE